MTNSNYCVIIISESKGKGQNKMPTYKIVYLDEITKQQTTDEFQAFKMWKNGGDIYKCHDYGENGGLVKIYRLKWEKV